MNSRLGLEVIGNIHRVVCNSDTHEVVYPHSQHVEEGYQKQIMENCGDGNTQSLYVRYYVNKDVIFRSKYFQVEC